MNSFHGAAVLIALLPVLPLAMALRRRSRDRRAFRGAATVSLVLLVCGIAAAVAGA